MSQGFNIIFREQADSLFDDLAVSLGVKMTFYSSTLVPLNRGRHNDISSYCSLIQKGLACKEICLKEDQKRCHEAESLRHAKSYTCHAGLREVVVPLIIEETVLGYALMGQIREEVPPPSHIMALAEACPVGRDLLMKAYEELPLFSDEQFDHGVSLFHHVVTYMMEKNMVILKSHMIVEKALAFMEEHMEENISLTRTADFVGRSASSLSRHFKMERGRSFKEILLDLKFRRAEKLFAMRPDLSVSQISDRLGFSEPAYFSRIYKKYRGLSPRQAYLERQTPPYQESY